MPARLDRALVTSEPVVESWAEAMRGRLRDVNVRSLGGEDPHWALAAAGPHGPATLLTVLSPRAFPFWSLFRGSKTASRTDTPLRPEPTSAGATHHVPTGAWSFP